MKSDSVFLLEDAGWPALIVDAAGTVLQANKAGRSLFAGPESSSATLSAIWTADNSISAQQFLADAEKSSRTPLALKLKEKSGTAVSYSASITTLAAAPEKRFLIQFFPATASAETKNSTDSIQAQKQKLDCA